MCKPISVHSWPLFVLVASPEVCLILLACAPYTCVFALWMLIVFSVHDYFANIKFQIPISFSLHKGSHISKRELLQKLGQLIKEMKKNLYDLHFTVIFKRPSYAA